MFLSRALGVGPLKPKEVAGGARRLVLAFAVVIAAILLASGVAIAATLEGTDDADTLEGTNNADTINGYGGGDTITGRDGPDDLDGGQGRDTIYGGGARDKVRGGPDDDTIYGGEGDDKVIKNDPNGEEYGGLIGGPGADTIRGGPGNDKIIPGPIEEEAEDAAFGDEGNDLIVSANNPARKDYVFCGPGQDKVMADKQDVVASDCEDVKFAEDEAQSARERGLQRKSGIAAFEKHMKVGRDGQLKLDKEGLNQEDVDPATKDQLQRALDRTNKKIRDGKIKASDAFPVSQTKRTPVPFSTTARALGSDEITAQACNGASGMYEGNWSGPDIYLSTCDLAAVTLPLAYGGVLGGIFLGTLGGPVGLTFGAAISLEGVTLDKINQLGGNEGVVLHDADPITGIPVVSSQADYPAPPE